LRAVSGRVSAVPAGTDQRAQLHGPVESRREPAQLDIRVREPGSEQPARHPARIACDVLTQGTRGSRSSHVYDWIDQWRSPVSDLIERKRLRPGDRLPPERDLAARIGVSRPTLRMGLHALAAMGCVQSRHGSGTFIREGPPALGTEPLSLLAALHDFTHEQMYETRRILEVGAAGLAAECATPDHIASLAEEVASLFA